MEEEPKALQLRGDPYKWESVDLPRDVAKLWEDVAKGIDKNQTGTLFYSVAVMCLTVDSILGFYGDLEGLGPKSATLDANLPSSMDVLITSLHNGRRWHRSAMGVVASCNMSWS